MYTSKNKELYINNGYKFRFHKLLAGNVERWCYAKKKPVGRFSKKKSNGEMSEITCHNHEPENSHTLQRQILSNRLKRKAMDELCERPAKILHTEITSEELNTLNGYDVSLIQKYIHHAQSAILPPRPKSFAELHVTLETFPLKLNLMKIFYLLMILLIT